MITTTVRKAPSSSSSQLPWSCAEELSINHWYKNKQESMPKVRVRLLYTDDRIHLKFEVQEEYVQAKYLEIQDPVCKDSCVEFFFSIDGSTYLNYEINCIGTYLCYKCGPNKKFDVNPTRLMETDFLIRTSLPKGLTIPDAMRCPPDGYTVEFSIPFIFINGALGGEPPTKGTVWKCNFYKCGGNLSNRRWGSWSELLCPELDFHKPEYFGQLIFG